MKKKMLFYALLLISSFAFQPMAAQNEGSQKKERKIITIDYEKCKEFAQKQKKAYQNLMDRYLKNDTTLTLEEGAKIYFGYAYTDAYAKYVNSSEAVKMYKKKNYAKAYKMYMKLLKKEPVSLQYLKLALNCSIVEKMDSSIVRALEERFKFVLHTVLATGTGKSIKDAFKVIRISDEYVIMYSLYDVEEFKGQKLLEYNYDLLSFIDERDHKEHKLFFDIRIHLDHLTKSLK